MCIVFVTVIITIQRCECCGNGRFRLGTKRHLTIIGRLSKRPSVILRLIAFRWAHAVRGTPVYSKVRHAQLASGWQVHSLPYSEGNACAKLVSIF
jgi:hypothetical protein